MHASISGYNGKDVPTALVQFKYASAVDALAKLDVLFARKAAAKEPAFLVGSQVTLADIAVISGLVRGYQALYDA